MDNSITLVRGQSKIFAVACYDQDGNGLVLTGAHKVIFTFRASETAATPLFQTLGVIEYVGTGPEDPGIVTGEAMPEDTIDLPEVDGWFDTWIFFLGHWFDEGTHAGLDFYFDYGKTREVVALVGVWTEVAAGHVTLADDDVNYVEVTKAGTVSANVVGFTAGSIPLYTVTTASGAITVIVDSRTVWGRGDRFFPPAKERFYLLESITKKAEMQSLGG